MRTILLLNFCLLYGLSAGEDADFLLGVCSSHSHAYISLFRNVKVRDFGLTVLQTKVSHIFYLFKSKHNRDHTEEQLV